MKITTYNPDGLVKKATTIDLQVPKYVIEYDEQHSFLNITSEEFEIINSKLNTFKRVVLLHRLTAAVEHDYKNFLKAFNVEVELFKDYESFMHNAESNPNIIAGDKVLSSILRIYGYRSRYSNVIKKQRNKFFSKETCTNEEFLIYINNVEHQKTNERGNVESSNWINIIIYHAFKSALNVRLQIEPFDIETRFFISLQNLINRYYYSLRNMERTVSWMPDELKQQKYVLSAFVNKADTNNGFHFNESLFYIKVINALYYMKERHRGQLYRMMSIVLNYHPSLTNEKHILNFCEKEIPKTVETEYEIRFHDAHNNVVKQYSITDNEIINLRLPSNIGQLSIFQYLLQAIFDQYVEMYQDKWEGNVKTDANIFFIKQKPYQEDWNAFYNHEVEKYRPTNLSSSKYLEPQDCFFYLLCDNIHPNKELKFTKDVIVDLIQLLIFRPCNSQEGLYECMFKMNYIKRHIGSKDPADDAVNKAMRYIGCLFEPDCELIMPYYRVKIKQLMEQILSLPDIHEKIAKVKPNGFTGGFNLKLIYNILGRMNGKKLNIISRGCGELDSYINNYAIEKGFVDINMERKSYINETVEINNSLKEINALISVFINKTLRVLDN